MKVAIIVVIEWYYRSY